MMYEHWRCDQDEQYDLAKSQSVLVGSFINPEAAQKMLGTKTYETTDEEFEMATKMVEDDIAKNKVSTKKRERKIRSIQQSK